MTYAGRAIAITREDTPLDCTARSHGHGHRARRIISDAREQPQQHTATQAETGNDDMSDEDGGSPRYNNPVATRAEPDSDFDEA